MQTESLNTQMAAKNKNKLSKFEWVKKNIVIVPVVAAILAGTFTSVRYVLSLTDTIEANKQTIINLQRDLTVAEDKLTEVATRLSAAEATWEMAENLYRQLDMHWNWAFYNIRDSRTLFSLMPRDPRKDIEFAAHNALEDCRIQSICVQKTLKHLGITQ